MFDYCWKCRQKEGIYIVKVGDWPSPDVCSPQKVNIHIKCFYCDFEFNGEEEFASLNKYQEFIDKINSN